MENTSANTQSSEKQSTGSTTSTRGKKDPAWEYFNENRDSNGRIMYICVYCGSSFKGGGIYRMKHHLAGIQGQISSCKRVPHDVRVRMRNYLNQNIEKQKEVKMAQKRAYEDYNDDDEVDEEVQEINPSNKRVSQQVKGKAKQSAPLDEYFAPRTIPGAQPSIKSALAGKELIDKAHMSLARWFYDACIPFNALNSPYFQHALNAIATVGSGYKGPSYHDMRINLLSDCKKECELLVKGYRSNWERNGCTIMADGWSDQRQRTLINFLVYCPIGICFVKSVDASDAVKDAPTLFRLFSEVVEWVGPANVVHIVTDNAANYVAAGRMLHEKYEGIYWSPCAAHCLNLILKDISSMNHVANLVGRASKVTVFVYNHIIFLSWLRKRAGWKEIVRPAATRFATSFITLKSIHEHKHDLQALATNNLFIGHKLSKSSNGKAFTSIVLDNKFWNDCLIMVKIAGPLIKLLRIVDSDEKPSLGYVYEGMRRARKAIKHIFLKNERFYEPYIKIIDERWDKHLRKKLHTASYFLNPSILYTGKFKETFDTMNGLYDLLEKSSICEKTKDAIDEIKMYRDRLGSFARKVVLDSCETTQPDEWWRLFGQSAPNLQKIAIRVLSQTASSSGCERNWSLFDRIHTKKRNRLEHQRLNDLVYVNYNLRLKNRLYYKKCNIDPIDIECIDKIDFWIGEKDSSPEFEVEELETAIYTEYVRPPVENSKKGQNIRDENEDNEHECETSDDVDIESFAIASSTSPANVDSFGHNVSFVLRDEFDDE